MPALKGAVARRYAEAILALAFERGTLERWKEELAIIRDLFTTDRVASLLHDPQTPLQRKRQLVEQVLGPYLSQEGLNLARILVLKGRASIVGDILMEFERMVDERLGIVEAQVVVPVEPTQDELDAIRNAVERMVGKRARLQIKVEPSIIGGVVIKIGDKLVDLSVAGKLEAMRSALAV
jgi:F-type H+-transporting ATPase subunit delta